MKRPSMLRIFKLLMVVTSTISLRVSGQSENTGINFESALSWREIQAKAKAENKYIFMDCYATWCGPCKWMAKNIFSQREVGEFINRNFIPVAVQMDQTARDSDEIKRWYSDARILADSFFVNEFPTYLFFSPDGQPVHRISGSTENGEAFIARVGDGLNPYKQCYTLVRNWREHTTDSIYLFHALSAAITIHSDQASIIEHVYIDQLRNPITEENLQLFGPLIHSSKDSTFELFLQHLSTIREVMGTDYAESILCPIIFREETGRIFETQRVPIYWNEIAGGLRKYPQLNEQLPQFEHLFRDKIKVEMQEYMNTLPQPDWKNTSKLFAKRFPGYDVELIFLQTKLDYCQNKGLAEEHAKTALAILNQYGNVLGDWDMNDLVWYHIFNITGNKQILDGALQWMKMSVSRRTNVDSYDTYANLLYKTGNLKEAIIWEKKCVELTMGDAPPNEHKIALDKMLNQQPTWNDGTPIIAIYNN